MDTVIEQRTEEWFKQRLGKVTASRAADVLAKLKTGGEAATRKNYKAQLVCERLTGKPQEMFESEPMKWGTEQEPFARLAFEAKTGLIVEECGFLEHFDLMAGASPDGLIGDTDTLEIKCPNTATHIETLTLGKAPEKYIPQIQFQMWITQRERCHFVSYDPRLPENLQLFIKVVERDNAFIAQLEREIRQFLSEVDEICNQLMRIAA